MVLMDGWMIGWGEYLIWLQIPPDKMPTTHGVAMGWVGLHFCATAGLRQQTGGDTAPTMRGEAVSTNLMSNNKKPKILITGATGQVGGSTIKYLSSHQDLEIVAAVRSPGQAAPFTAKGMATVILDFDVESTHLPAFTGIDRLLLVTG